MMGPSKTDGPSYLSVGSSRHDSPIARLSPAGAPPSVACPVFPDKFSDATEAPLSRLQNRSVWDLVIFVLNAAIFLLLGVQFRALLAGVPPDMAVFDAFYTTKRGGMGIGLSVSRSSSRGITVASGRHLTTAPAPRSGSRSWTPRARVR